MRRPPARVVAAGAVLLWGRLVFAAEPTKRECVADNDAAPRFAPAWQELSSITKRECVADNYTAQELRQAGKLLEAREKLVACASPSCPGVVRDDCAERLDEVSAATPSVVFEAKDAAGNDVGGVRVAVDGRPWGELDGTPFAVDPGEHRFVFEAPGAPSIEKDLVVVEGVKLRHEVVVLAVPRPSPPVGARFPWGSPPPLAWAAFGVGGAGLAVGVVAGLVAGGKHATLSGECDDDARTCAPQYAGDLDSFHSLRTVSTVGYVFAGLGAAAGGLLWFAATKTQGTTTASVWVGPATAGIAGRF